MQSTQADSHSRPEPHLLELPLYLLYRIVDQLDLRDQRHLFMTCSQLHNKWQLHFSQISCSWERHLYTPRCRLLWEVLTPQQGTLPCATQARLVECPRMPYADVLLSTQIFVRRGGVTTT